LADLVNGEVVGDPQCAISGALPVADVGSTDITFLESDKFLTKVEASPAAAVVVPAGIHVPGKNLIRVADPLMAFIAIFQHFRPRRAAPEPRIHWQASVDPSAELGDNVAIDAFAVIGPGCVIGDGCRIHSGVTVGADCRIGRNVTLYPQVVLYANTIIGDRVIIHAHAVIGADGFGYRMQNGKHVKVPQLGWVEIGDDVEIGAGTTIDRGTFSATKIGAGTKIDNLVMIAHNCHVGKHNIFVSQMGMAGSSSTGEYVVVAGQVGVVEHVNIGDRCIIGGQAAVTKDVPADSRMLGSPATDAKEQMRILKSLQHLPEWRKELRDLQEKVDRLSGGSQQLGLVG
jgi:UDP-3-O-[3-hydroxymyristoyl] glucosamine N-acyltransferase